jgi:hypothetical protein
MTIKHRVKSQRFTASSGNVCRFKVLGRRRRIGGGINEYIDASWERQCSPQDIAEANAFHQKIRPDIARMFSCHINDPIRRAEVANQFLYGSSQN